MSVIQRLHTILTPSERTKVVKSVEIKPIMEDATGSMNITDIQFQGGVRLTGYMTNTQEMLRKLREDGNPAIPKYFNAVVRGRKTLIIPNRGEYLKIDPTAPVVTAPIDFTLWVKQEIPVNSSLSHFYRTRIFIYKLLLAVADKLEFLAQSWVVKHNDIVKEKNVDYTGMYFECPLGDNRFNIDLISEESELRPQPSVRILVDIQEWEADKGAIGL